MRLKVNMGITNMKAITIKDTGKLSTSEMMAHLKTIVDVYYCWDNKDLDTNFPKPKKPTERIFNLNPEPDVKNKSWNNMADIRESMMTFREYILFVEAYHNETGEYPDKIGWTIFKDSLPDGHVACGDWYSDGRRVGFYWSNADYRDSSSGGRVAISLKPCDSIAPLDEAIKLVKEAGYVIYKPI